MTEFNERQSWEDLKGLRRKAQIWRRERDEPVIDLTGDEPVVFPATKYPESERIFISTERLEELFSSDEIAPVCLTVPERPTKRTLRSIFRANKERQEYSLGVRVRKRLGDIKEWAYQQIDLKGEHATRNKIILGVGAVAVAYFAYKGFTTGSKGQGTEVANQQPAPGSKGSSAGEGVANNLPPAPRPSTTTSTLLENTPSRPPSALPTPEPVPQPVPVEAVPQPEFTQITITQPGQGMWHVLRDQGYNDNQIWRMLHGYADQQGVSYESLNWVEVGESFNIPTV